MATIGKPPKGRVLGVGAEGTVYAIPNDPNNVLKEFHPGGTSPFQARNEYQNLAKARGTLPDNVVQCQQPSNPKQGWLVKERVYRLRPNLNQQAERPTITQQLVHSGVHDVPTNLIFGCIANNLKPRWILIE
jgi:hypothetical protein